MSAVMDDLRYGLRLLWRHPSFSLLAILTLALGIGANTTVFSLIRSVLLKPLPFAEAGELLWIGGSQSRMKAEEEGVSIPDFKDLGQQARSLRRMAAYSFFNEKYNITGLGEPEQIDGVRVTAAFFDVFGVAPIHGRTYRPGEDDRSAPRRAVISHSLWMRDYAGDPAAVGRNIIINSVSHEIIGVMPPEFQFPPRAEVWLPLLLGGGYTTMREARPYLVVARASGPAGLANAPAELASISRTLEQSYTSNQGYRFVVTPLQERLTGSVSATLYLLAGITGFLLLIAAANIANLLLARGTTRRREFAIRQAMGAQPASLLRQVLVENLVLSISGGVIGAALAWWAVRAIRLLNPWELPRVEEVGVDPLGLAFALGASVLTAVTFGFAPALQAMREPRAEELKDSGTRGGGESAGTMRLRAALVVAEVAIAVVLLAGAGLLMESLRRLMSVHPGFQSAGVVTTELTLPRLKFKTLDATAAFTETYLDRVRALPGVTAAGAAITLPIGARYNFSEFKIIGDPPPPVLPIAGLTPVTRGYFEAMGIPLRQGRLFDQRDGRDSPKTIIISEPMARQHFGGRDPIGRQVEIVVAQGQTFAGEVIGVVGGVRHENLASDPRVEVYVPFTQLPYPLASVIVKAAGSPDRIGAALKQAMRELDRDIPVYRVRTMEDVILESASQARSRGFLTSLFALAALLLASFGIYGVMSYAVSRRTQEIGIRVSIGATPMDVLWLVLRQSGNLVLAGVATGLVLAVVLGRVISTLLFQVSVFDWRVLSGVSGLLLSAALFATLLPAWRAARIDPVRALRQE